MSPRKNADAEPSFEAILRKLEDIVRKLEEEELPLETALKLFAEGQALARACEARLQAADNQVRQLLQTAGGSIDEVPFAPGPSADACVESEDSDRPPNAAPPDVPRRPPDSDRDDLPF